MNYFVLRNEKKKKKINIDIIKDEDIKEFKFSML